MAGKRGRLTEAIAGHAEDLALAIGATALSAGIGLEFGYPCGLIALGAIALAYGVWITERRP